MKFAEAVRAWVDHDDLTALELAIKTLREVSEIDNEPDRDRYFPGSLHPSNPLRDLAIPPVQAANCATHDLLRTGALMKGTHNAILRELERKNAPVHLVELGSGPLAPVALSNAALFTPDQLRISCVDLFPLAIKVLERTADKLQLQTHVKGLHSGNLTRGDWSFLTPDVVALEAMKPGLVDEPQGRITAHLARQFSEETLWIPEDITVSLLIKNNTTGETTDYGPAYGIDEKFRRLARSTPVEDLIRVKKVFELKAPIQHGDWVHLRTDIILAAK